MIRKQAFTLIELSITLVIIGLIVGGVLVGRDLIGASQVRAQVSQIEKYQSAMNTFRLKYGYLPGDIPEPAATSFGFVARGIYDGEGDGNGIIQGVWADGANGRNGNTYQIIGETAMFWADLSKANLIDGNFSAAQPNGNASSSLASALFPTPAATKIGSLNVYSIGADIFLSLSLITTITSPYVATTVLTAQQAYNIDNKTDDGMPLAGRVFAVYLNGNCQTISGTGGNLCAPRDPAKTNFGSAPLAASATSCFDNNNITSPIYNYSVNQSNGNAAVCGLNFKF